MTSNHGYSSSTVSGNTRKYHGLFVQDGRLLLAGLDETVNGMRISTQQYERASDDKGLQYLYGFSVYPPSWVYWIDDVIVRKTITFDGDLSIVYDISGDADLQVRPLITDRLVNEVLRDPHPDYTNEHNGFRWRNLFFKGILPYEPHPETYWNIWYEREHERGYEPVEDLYSPGVFQGQVQDSAITFRCNGNSHLSQNTTHTSSPQTTLEWLEWASNTFYHGDEIFAGYHWFCESWGRDSAISVTGLLIERGLKEKSRAVLKRLSDMNKDGVIPNRFPDNYHTSDASLWFIQALSGTGAGGGTITSWRK